MKIVCIGDLLLPPEMMERATENFQRYDEKRYFYFGPKSHEEMRIYIKIWRLQVRAVFLCRTIS